MNGSESFPENGMTTLSDHHPLATVAGSDHLLENSNNSSNSSDIDSKTDSSNPIHQSEIPEPYLTITVSNPQKQLESSSTSIGNSYYITYLITTKTNIHEFGGPHFTVRRRFNDFLTLSDRLTEAYRGFFIPPRPDKSVVESQVMQKHEFVEQRRYALEKYLHRLGGHPVIAESDELRVFLQVQGKLPLLPTAPVASRMFHGATELSKQLFLGDNSVASSQPQDIVQPAKSRWDFMRIIKEMNQAVSNNTSAIYDEDDAHFFQIRDRMHNLQNQLTNASKQEDLFVKAQQDMSDTMGAFGLSFIKLTKFENQQAVLDTQTKRAVHMKNLATSAIKASRLYRELNTSTVKHLDTLHDHVELMQGVHTAFSDRSSALLTVQTLTSELDSLYSRVEKLETASSKSISNDKPNSIKLGVLRESIRVAEDAKSCATREYERIKENNRTETERLDRGRKVDFKNMLKGFVFNQVALSEKLGKEWANVVEDTSGYAKHGR